jgi:hypothetical protein
LLSVFGLITSFGEMFCLEKVVLPWDMVENSISPLQTFFRPFFVSGQSRQATFSCKKASSIDFCSHFPSPPHGMTPHPHLASRPLKCKPVARGRREPRKQSIVGWFFVLPSQESVVGSVALAVCRLVRAAV